MAIGRKCAGGKLGYSLTLQRRLQSGTIIKIVLFNSNFLDQLKPFPSKIMYNGLLFPLQCRNCNMTL